MFDQSRRLTILLVVALAGPLSAVNTSHWTHNNQAEFKKGALHNVVVSNLGDLKLSRAVKTVLEQDPRVSSVYALAEAPDGTIYAGTGPHGVLLQIKQEKVTDAAVIGDINIFSLGFDGKGRLLIGTGGDKGRILRVNKPGEKPAEIFSAEDVQYVWAIQTTPDGLVYAATGPNGQLFEIKPDGSKAELFKSSEHNLLSMVSDGKDLLYIGTDPNGLVFRLNRKTKEMFVLFNAPESEITALVLDAKGNLYAATGETSEQAGPEQPDNEAAEKAGRPEGGAPSIPLPSHPPSEPKPPALPDPTPGEPRPIPKAPASILSPSSSVLYLQIAPGSDEPTPPHPAPPASAKAPQPSPGAQPQPEPAEKPPHPEGNAIYRIDPEGFVRELFRQNTAVFSLVEKDGLLLVGTGDEGLIYQVNPEAEETVVLAKVDPKAIVSMLVARDGRVLLGLANVGGLATLSSGFAPEGTYTSPVLDAAQVSRFGKIHLTGSLPAGTTLTLATRSGNVAAPASGSPDPSDAPGWSNWTAPASATEYAQVTSPPARFFQYRLTLASKLGKESPIVDQVDVAYQMPNLPPEITAIKVTIGKANEESDEKPAPAGRRGGAAPPAEAPHSRFRTITWEAADPNDDALDFALYFRSGSTGPWILLKDKPDVDPSTGAPGTRNSFEWDTQAVGDGRYQVKLVACDARANLPGQGKTASRVSEMFIIDNTPPRIGDLKVTLDGNSVHVEARLVDRTSTVAAAGYAVDSRDDWQAVLPADGIFDSPEEVVSFAIPNLPPGAHQIMIRATDAFGNHGYESVAVTVK